MSEKELFHLAIDSTSWLDGCGIAIFEDSQSLDTFALSGIERERQARRAGKE